jgi:hypothetical protein
MSLSATNGLHQAPRTAASGEDREKLLRQAAQHHQEGRLAAEAGDLSTAARSILQGLDCERRAGGLGPQVLQLIKPR